MSKSKFSKRRILFRAAFAALVFSAGCGGSAELRRDGPASIEPNDGLNSTLWSLKSAEYDATTLTIYEAAREALTRGLKVADWTALPEQEMGGGYSDLPPAVVLDVDETVLDNGPYQAGLVVKNETYGSDSWLQWVLEARAGAIPGALAFTQRAREMGVTVIYVTNRRGNMEQATRQNLSDLGFPVDSTFDVVLTRGERPEWSAGEKSTRRSFVAAHFRVLALIGDNLGDFIDSDSLNLEERDGAIASALSFWGARWFMLPNPQYGSWESAAFENRYDLSPNERRRLKMELLQTLLDR